MKKRFLKGFTLIELIIVIAVIALLAAATFVAINPAKRVGDANNSRRWSDITAIADAYQAYLADNSGTHPTTTANSAGITYSITSSTQAHVERCAADTTNGNATTTSANIDLEALVTSGYIGSIPSDPGYVVADTYNTGYYLYRESTGKLVVGACDAYSSQNIEVVR